LDPQYRTVERRGEVIILTPTEFKLLSELVSHEGQVLTHQVLMDRVWGYLGTYETSIIKGQIYNLRHKLETDPARPVYIRTIPGAGYSFRRRESSTESDRSDSPSS
jgi:two-component system KDP operon response regulator KdpE